jgi:hypothetical protein
MLDLTTYQLVRGINPNLAAGQRALKISQAAFGGGLFIHQPNSPFYNFGSGPFTIYARFCFLGHEVFDGGSNELAFVNKANAGGTGWVMYLKGNAGPSAANPLRAQFGFFSGGANGGLYANTPWPLDGRFHTLCVTRSTSTVAEASDLNNVRFFIDGVRITDLTYYGGMVDFDTNNEIQIGGTANRFFRGYLDCVAFYSAGLTDTEIALLDNPATRTDRSAKFIQDYNQVSAPGGVLFDSTSLKNNATAEFTADWMAGKGFIKIDGIRTFAAGSVLQAPVNGHFTPAERVTITGVSCYDADLTAAEYSLDGSAWLPLAFDAAGRAQFAPNLDINPAGVSPTLYLRATNANPNFLNALELIY